MGSDAEGARGCLQAALVHAGVMEWALPGKTLPCCPVGVPPLPAPGSSQPLPHTNTFTRCEVVEHQVQQLETWVLCERWLGTTGVARGCNRCSCES